MPRRAGHPQSRAAGQAAYSGMVPEHGPLFLRLDRRGQGSSALRPRDFGHRSSRGGRCAIARGDGVSGDLRLAHVTPPDQQT